MNTAVPKDIRSDAARSLGHSGGDWLDELVTSGTRPRDAAADHVAGMRAIADQMAKFDGPVRRPASFDPAALRDAVAEITRRQAMLDASPSGEAAGAREPAPERQAAALQAAAPQGSAAAAPEPDPVPRRSGLDPAEPILPFATSGRGSPGDDRGRDARWTPERSGARRAGMDLSAEVSHTFARFSRDMIDAIHASDVRPEIEALDRQVRTIGRAVDGLGANLNATPSPTASSPELTGTLAEMRGLLDSFKPGATIASLETRIDGLAKRLERGSADPSLLIEGLSRRVDEIHHSLRSQLQQSAVDTGPLESLVRGISDRIGQARANSNDFEQLELAMRDVAARIDRVPAGTDPGGVKALESQIARIGDRLDRSEASLRAIDGVEHSLGELFSQFEVTRQVAIDAAESAARTAARDTLRAALQSPGLTGRSADLPSALADQMTRGIDDLRAMQEIAQRRTQDALSQIHEAMERLARHMAGADSGRPSAAATRDLRRPDTERTRAGDVIRAASPPAPDIDTPIEPGSGRAGVPRTEPRFGDIDEAAPSPDPVAPAEGDGPATFIAAARRAAQAAQASAATAAALKAGERIPAPPKARGVKGAATGEAGALSRARALLTRRRRPLLLGLAALVMLVGALEVVNLGIGSPIAGRTGMADAAQPERPKARVADLAVGTPEIAPAAKPAAAEPAPAKPATASSPPLPTLLGGAPMQPQTASGTIPGGLKSLAASGDAAAQYEVGLRYADGRGVARDPKEAAGWLSKAAAQGLAPAEYRLGSAYEKGVGTERDPALAMSWYAKAAEAGNIKAMHNLAVMAAEGAAGKPDYAKAAQWFQKASSFGVRDSEFNLAILYARGLGIEQSLPKSYTWFAAAASAGDEDAAKKRDEVAAKLDAASLAAAKAAADALKPATPVPAANDVAAPAGGWDAVGAKVGAAAAEKVTRL